MAINIPTDVVNALGIKDGDDVDFFEYNKASFLFAKKADIVMLITKLQERREMRQKQQQQPSATGLHVSTEELAVLKKLDTLRYNERTKDKVGLLLDSEEKQLLQNLIKRGLLSLFKKAGESELKYSIPKDVYDMFLYRKKAGAAAATAKQPEIRPAKQVVRQAVQPKGREWENRLSSSTYVELLESKGFLVLTNDADAANASAALEHSIRQGLVVGIRAFNKKFYIALRGFITKNAPKVIKVVDEKAVSVPEIAKKTGIEEDGVRAILYIMAEDGGSVMEVREDIFRAA